MGRTQDISGLTRQVMFVLIQDIPPLAAIPQHHDMVQPFQYVSSTMLASPRF